MLTTYEARSGALEPHKNPRQITEQAIWIDLLNPKREEERKVERALKLEVPTREEQREIEASSRLYQENGAHFMTATVLYHTETAEPITTPITFILAGNKLITLRYAEPHAFSIFAARCRKPDPKSQQRDGGADRTDRDHRRSHGGLHRAHPRRGRAVIAFDL